MKNGKARREREREREREKTAKLRGKRNKYFLLHLTKIYLVISPLQGRVIIPVILLI